MTTLASKRTEDPATDPAAVPPEAATPATVAAWERPALAVLLLTTAILYLWGLGASGWANEYYSAAVQAGTHSWQALFFGSLDAGGAITVDKPPASLWVMGLSGRIFGFNSWSMLVPQALMGVGSVALLYATVRRWSGAAAGLFAGAVFALTPVTVLIFRFNNPDALLVLLLLAGAYCLVRACETASTRWLVLAGVAIGAGFLTKMLQSFLVLPAFALVYLIAAPTPVRRRLWQLLVAGAALAGTVGTWIAVVSLWPASDRPYIGGSTDNSALQLALGYNGLGRLFGSENGGGPGGNGQNGGPTNDRSTSFGRLFEAGVGEQAAWLLPAALLALVIGFWLTARAPRTDRIRASLVLWGGWLLVTGAVFTTMTGKFHGYYTVALAPAIGAILAVTGRELWSRRHSWVARAALAVLSLAAGWWSYVLLDRTPSWHPEVRYAVAVGTAVAITALVLGPRIARFAQAARTSRHAPAALVARLAPVAMIAAMVAALIGTTGFAVATAAVPHAGNDATAGPVMAGGDAKSGQQPGGQHTGGGNDQEASSVSPAMIAALSATTTRWAAATSGAQAAAPLELASGRPVIGIGGFTGSDPAPTLSQFQRYVASGQVSYFVDDGRGGGGHNDSSGPATKITAWVTANFTASTIGGVTVYDLTSP